MPFAIRTEREHLLAKSLSCVTITIEELYSLDNSKNRFKITSAVSLSKLPVGSSAKIHLGLETKALATDTLCFSPPIIKGSATFSIAVKSGNK